jgi:hypothetical protein
MTSATTVFKTALISAIAASTLIATPAMATSNKDVQKCRTALTAQGDLNMSDYRLRFERQDGQRTKTLHFKAIPHDGGEVVDVTCTLKRSKVLALNTGSGEVTMLAENAKK